MRSFAIAAIIVLAAVAPARAANTYENPERPSLFTVNKDTTKTEIPLVSSHLSCEVRGPIAQVTLVQSYTNSSADPIEAVYVFPLHSDSAVGGMTMHIGDRTIRAVIKTREDARATYDKAKADGKAAALLDEERPNIFTQSVANILPGEEIDVEIVYDVLLEPDAGMYELALPTVVGPRYIGGEPLGGTQSGGGTAPDTDRVPDASRITPPVATPGESTGNDYGVDLDLDAGMKITDITSPTHAIDVAPVGGNHIHVTLAEGTVPADKDIVIRWRTTVDSPTVAVLADRSDGTTGHLALVLQPPPAKTISTDKREMVFVIDSSGSMDGEPIALVKRGIRRALEDLGPDDTFRIINFSTDVSGFRNGAVLAATPRNLRDARSWLNGVIGDGSTEMLGGIEAALATAPEKGRTRYVVFMTDGYIGDEATILAAINRLRDARTHLFSFGVGSAANRYLLDEMARVGDGVADYMLLDEDPAGKLDDFFSRICAPAMTDVHVDWGSLAVQDPSPHDFGSVFPGRPIVIAARYTTAGTGTIEVKGEQGGKEIKMTVPVTLPEGAGDGSVLGRLWARRRIAELSRAMTYETVDAAAITKIALDYSLMSPYTSFVAVDEHPRVGAPGATVQVPVDLPEGVDMEAITGGYGSTYGSSSGGSGEVIEIAGTAPTIDPTSTMQGIALDTDYTASVPLPGRTYVGTLGAVSGSTSLENEYYVDGVDTAYLDHRPLPRWRLSLSAGGGYDLDGERTMTGFSSSIEYRLGSRALALGATGSLWRLDDRSLTALLATISKWNLLRLFDVQLGLGVGELGPDAGVAWRLRIAAPLPIGGIFQPELDVGLDGVTLDDQSVLGTSVGIGVRF